MNLFMNYKLILSVFVMFREIRPALFPKHQIYDHLLNGNSVMLPDNEIQESI